MMHKQVEAMPLEDEENNKNKTQLVHIINNKTNIKNMMKII